MKFDTKLKLCLWKRYFDVGYSLTNYLKYFIAFFGLASRDVTSTLFIALGYGICCYFLGWIWLNSDFYRVDTELSNRYNIFVEEMRRKIK